MHSAAPSRGGVAWAQIFHRRLSGSISILDGVEEGCLVAIRRGSSLTS
jgi:hypothetical protein